MHFLEGALIMWTLQIKELMAQAPSLLFGNADDHPAPVEIVRFWEHKAINLNLVWDQLEGRRIKKVLYTLDKARSTYLPEFRRLVKALLAEKSRANAMFREMTALKDAFQELHSTDEISVVRRLLRPLFHGLMLLWVHGKHLSEDIENVVLPVRCICNEVVLQGAKALGGTEIFETHVDEAKAQIERVVQMGLELQMHYLDSKQRAGKADRQRPWRVPMQTMFDRLDRFLERCGEVKEILEIAAQVQTSPNPNP